MSEGGLLPVYRTEYAVKQLTPMSSFLAVGGLRSDRVDRAATGRAEPSSFPNGDIMRRQEREG
jgi:hypothetical protein